ncbi:hypothetical protein [Methylobacterium sp. GXS13]|uniref:hypothetical protein n=1 Tax=Methylobacterium sp. GXS13 TaxID=1730094 RepID=UPI000AAD204B|nr:hypothetical protein [Methylobacterium sp. GXS13]
MADGGDDQWGEEPRSDRALAAAGVVGTWEWDHRRKVARYSRGAAELLAGDAELAGRDLAPEEALAGVYDDDVAWLRSQIHQGMKGPGVAVREHRVRSQQHGVRRVLCRGRTFFDTQGNATTSIGIVIDITELEADGHRRFGAGDDEGLLHAAADHGVAAYEAIEATALPSLLQPARALLMAIGREIAQMVSKGPEKLH